MSKLPVASLLIVVGLLWPVSAAAQSGGEDDMQHVAASSLFDGIGAPLMRISGPIYLQLGVRDKLRGLGGTNGGDGSGAGAGTGGSSGGGTSPGSGADTGTTPGSGSGGDPGDGSGSDGTFPVDPVPGSGDTTGDDVHAVPEPALLSLIIPGALLALRRRTQQRHSRSA